MLSQVEKNIVRDLNKRNYYKTSIDELKALILEHKNAYKHHDHHSMELIEFRLTDLNYATICDFLIEKEYDEAYAVCELML